MTTIDKIALCGIRSYDPNSLVVIKFFKPLTIILGNNGSGKTTIIEALKYVCCGDVPPLSDRGKSFVHDPKHCGVNVVKAQVKVAFKTRDDKPVIVNSSMQLTQKRSQTQFKTIDGVVRMFDESTNEQIALSHKCADMKKVVPELMGVSRAILDNVIFCHQEDANWPLSEAKKLKEKFDEIFATSRWSKALININQYKKTLNSRSKDLKADLKVFENNKEIAHKLTNDLEQTKIRMAKYKDLGNKYISAIKQLKSDIIPLQDAHKKLRGFDAHKRVLENDIIHLKKQQKSAHQRMNCEYEETDEELKAFLKNHDEQIREKENELKTKENEYITLKRELRVKQEHLRKLHVNKGKVTQIVDDLKHKEEDITRIMKELNTKYSMDETNMDTIVNVLRNIQGDKKEKMEEEHTVFLSKDDRFEKEINNNIGKRNEFEYKSNHLLKQRRDYDSKSRHLTEKLKKNKEKINECKNMEKEIKNIRFRVNELNDNDATKEWEQRINEYQCKMQDNADKMRSLNEERRALQGQAQQTAKLQFKAEQYKSAKDNYNKSLHGIKSKVISVLDRMPSMNELKHEFNEKNRSLKESFEGAQRKYNKMTTEQRVFESNVSSIEREKERLEQRLSGDILKLSECSLSLDDDMDELMDSARETARNKQSEFALAKCGRTLYSKFNKLARKKKQCPVCQRHFDNDNELQSFIKTNSTRIKSVEKSGAIEKHEKDASKARKKLETLQGLVPVYESAIKERKELKLKLKEFEGQNKEYKKYEEELEEMFAVHIEKKASYDKSSILVSNVNELCRQYVNVERLHNDYEREKERLKEISQSKRNLNDVENEYDVISKENNDKNNAQHRLRKQIGEYDKKKRDAHSRLIKLQQKYANYNELKKEEIRMKQEVQDINVTREEMEIEIAKIQSEMEPIVQVIRSKQEQRQAQRSITQEKERSLQQDLAHFSNDIHSLEYKIKQYSKLKGRVAEYSDIARDISGSESEYRELQNKFTRIEEIKQSLSKWLDNVVVDKQDLLSNLEFRKFDRLVTDKKGELQGLKNEMNEICDDAENTENKINSKQTKVAIEQSNLDQSKGGMESEKRKAVELMTQLRTQRFTDIDEKYREQLIKFETTLIAGKDLDKFEKALDKSLIEFHSLKMKEINSVLKELWQQTYRGKDIDYIEIVSEIGSRQKRKTYNYKVVMIQGDASLSMRGRCSAGQRVLAALLIRLALAETFCLNCGVLALDEPTTNLDSKNIEALAYALNQIITRRKRQENFQLILITHDEAFVEKLGQREHTDGYYRVFKNEYQHSKAKLYKFDTSRK